MLLLVLIVIAVIIVVLLVKAGSGSRYSQTQHWADFDPGVDTKKVGDPRYPHAAMDSVIKYEFLDDVMKDDK